MKVTTWIVAAFAVGGFAFRQDPATDLEITVTEGTNIAAAASPDRRSIAMDLQGGLWVLPIAGGEAKRITPETFEARQPTWSPDSQSIAFQGYDDNAWHIYAIRVDVGDFRRPRAAIPEHDDARAIPLRNDALELAIVDRMILDVHREPLRLWIEGWSFGHSP